jgi:hypothetical protein
MKNSPIGSIIFAVLGVMGSIIFITLATRSGYKYGFTCCDECKWLTVVLVTSMIVIIVGLNGMFGFIKALHQK